MSRYCTARCEWCGGCDPEYDGEPTDFEPVDPRDMSDEELDEWARNNEPTYREPKEIDHG